MIFHALLPRVRAGAKRRVRSLATTPQQREALRNGILVNTPDPSKLIKTDLQAHLQWLESQKPSFETNREPPLFADPSGVVKHDLTKSMFDLKDMYDPRIHLATAPNWDKDGYEASTPLTDDLIALIGATGKPITVAEYMRQALTHPLYGYYTSPEKDDQWEQLDEFDENVTPGNYIIGAKGDFVTAPEISEIFGESIAVWFMIQWQTIGKPKDIQIVEVGPGKGTLICDVLMTFLKSFKDHCGESLRTVHLVEASPAMRAEQRRKLEELNVDVKFVFEEANSAESLERTEAIPADLKQIIRVQWHDCFASFHAHALEIPTFFICQELLDALPIYAFQKTENGWRERMVDVAVKPDDDGEQEEQAPSANTTTEVNDTSDNKTEDESMKKLPRLRIVVAPEVTPALKTLLNVGDDGQIDDDVAEVGAIIEVCPEGIFLAQDIYKFINKNGGAALIIDYGEEGSSDSIRGFSKHKQVSFLSRPGQVDVTADVDFSALKHAVNSLRGADNLKNDAPFAFGPIQQGKFLVSMGAAERAMHIIDDVKTTDQQASELHDALERLISPDYMGHRYKVLAIGRKKDGIFAPAGF